MSNERFLLDTVFVQALLNQRDQYHAKAKAFLPRVRDAAEVWITEAVLIEIGNALSHSIARPPRNSFDSATKRPTSASSAWTLSFSTAGRSFMARERTRLGD